MHRTQVLLEQWQYDLLRARSRREGKSLSQLVREALTAALKTLRPSRASRGLEGICGIASDPSGPAARDHDEFLYGKPKSP